jgi:membrane-associated protein
MFASILSVAHNLGYPTLVLLIMLESSGVPLPGETALITAAVLASQHRLQIAPVIALAAAAAIMGDNVGYLIGRKGGRWLLRRPGPYAHHRARVLGVGEPFFARHGSKAVFLGRWILGLRTWALDRRASIPHVVAPLDHVVVVEGWTRSVWHRRSALVRA